MLKMQLKLYREIKKKQSLLSNFVRERLIKMEMKGRFKLHILLKAIILQVEEILPPHLK